MITHVASTVRNVYVIRKLFTKKTVTVIAVILVGIAYAGGPFIGNSANLIAAVGIFIISGQLMKRSDAWSFVGLLICFIGFGFAGRWLVVFVSAIQASYLPVTPP